MDPFRTSYDAKPLHDWAAGQTERRGEVRPRWRDPDQGATRDARLLQQTGRRIAVLPRELSQHEGELTPTLKIKRRVIDNNFKEQIEALYASSP